MMRQLILAVLAVAFVSGCGGDDPVKTDTTPPGRVGDLQAGSVTTSSVRLSWTASGDDGDAGTAAAYDIRYATNGSAGWDDMTQATGEPAPQANGRSEVFTVSGLSEATEYTFRLQVADDAGNWSEVSNAATGATGPPADVYPPVWNPPNVGTGYRTSTSIDFWWYAPYDNNGPAARYDIRMATQPNTPWDEMTVVPNTLTPRASGEMEYLTLGDLTPSASYYVRIKAADSADNWSAESREAGGSTTNPGEIGGTIVRETVWGIEESPYRLVENVTLNAKLTIEPGVVVRAAPGVWVSLADTLVAEARGGDSIRLENIRFLMGSGIPTIFRDRESWAYVSGTIFGNCIMDGTTFDGPAGPSFVACTFRNAWLPPLRYRQSDASDFVNIVDCLFEANQASQIAQAACIELDGGDMYVEGTTMRQNRGSMMVFLALGGSATFVGCRFEDNQLLQPQRSTIWMNTYSPFLGVECSSFARNTTDPDHGYKEISIDCGSCIPTVRVTNCNFIRDPDRSWLAIDNFSHGRLDARNNWWGTTDRALIEWAIKDSVDAPNGRGRVSFEPFLSDSVNIAGCGGSTGR